MEPIKKFLLDDSGSAEATTIILLIAAAGIFLAVGVGYYCNAAGDFFNTAGGWVDSLGDKVPK